MPYRKFRADYLFTGINLLDNTSVLITDAKGNVEEIVDHTQAGEGVEIFKGILSPGFINSHCHLELSHLKNKIPEKTGLANFVYKVVTERHFPEEEILDAMKTAKEEMIKNGIVAIGDICNNNLSLSAKEDDSLHYYNFIEASGWNPDVALERFGRSKFIYDNYIGKDKNVSIVPHSPYSVSSALWEKITPFFSGKIVSIHNQETLPEDEFFLEGTGELVKMYEMMRIDNSFYKAPGKRSIQSYFHKLSSAASVILVHNTFTKQEDIDYINEVKSAEQLLSFCICPSANIYIENTFPPVFMLLENEANVVIGTDSLASNHQLDILEELKLISGKWPKIKTEILLNWATYNGAKALQMDDTLGSFKKGMQPGIVLIENIQGDRFIESSKARKIL